MPVPAMRKVRQRRNGGEFYRRGRKAAFDAGEGYPQLTLFIREVLAQDPRPAIVKVRKRAKPMPSGYMILTLLARHRRRF